MSKLGKSHLKVTLFCSLLQEEQGRVGVAKSQNHLLGMDVFACLDSDETMQSLDASENVTLHTGTAESGSCWVG